MAEIQWNALNVPDIGGTFMNAFQKGAEMKRQHETRNALSTLVQNPNDPTALGALAKYDPATALAFRKQQVEQQAAQQKTHGEQMQVLGRLLNHATDEVSYQQAKAAAQQAGLDVSSAPANFDPAYVARTRMLVDAYNKDGGQALSTFGKIATDEGLQPGTPQFTARVSQLVQADQVKTIPYTQGGGVAGYNPATGQINTIVAPNPGGYAAGAPVGGAFREGQTATNPQTGEKIQFRGGQWVPMGGGSGNATGGFQP